VVAILAGARARWHTGVLEVSLRAKSAGLARVIARLPFVAVTFGHVVLARSEADQGRLRVHERVHVAQYEAWGAFFLLAYPAESLFQFLAGHHPYRDNRFEVSARAVAAGRAQASSGV
jgi:hypothetical protein